METSREVYNFAEKIPAPQKEKAHKDEGFGELFREWTRSAEEEGRERERERECLRIEVAAIAMKNVADWMVRRVRMCECMKEIP
jgi:hypothetical protein